MRSWNWKIFPNYGDSRYINGYLSSNPFIILPLKLESDSFTKWISKSPFHLRDYIVATDWGYCIANELH